MDLSNTSLKQTRSWLPAMSSKWLLVTTAVALAIRFVFIFVWGTSTPDGEVYAEIAKTWLRTGVYGLHGATAATPTYIRLPGYPAFLAVVFSIAGVDHYNAVRFVQAFVDVATGFVVADLARRVISERAGNAALVLWALCPFPANYVAAPLTETFSIFCSALALLCVVIGLDSRSWKPWIVCGLAVGYGIQLRPDGGMLLITIGLYLLWHMLRTRSWQRTIVAGVVVAFFALAPLLPWAIRNYKVFHVFQPLVPAAANEPGEFVPFGFGKWQTTWLVDYASIVDIGFKVDGEPISVNDLPNRARGDAAEFARLKQLFAQYNDNLAMTPEMDAGFMELANARIKRAPFENAVLLPAARAIDLWMRPRNELLPVDVHWWDIDQGWQDVATGVALGLVNLFYIGIAVAGLATRRIRYVGLLAGFCVLRTAIITAIQFPEPRYTLECYPAVIVFGAALWGMSRWRRHRAEIPVAA